MYSKVNTSELFVQTCINMRVYGNKWIRSTQRHSFRGSWQALPTLALNLLSTHSESCDSLSSGEVLEFSLSLLCLRYGFDIILNSQMSSSCVLFHNPEAVFHVCPHQGNSSTSPFIGLENDNRQY